MSSLRTLACLVLMLAPDAAAGESLRLEGRFIQGGLVFGRAVPGARVRLDEHAVRVSPAGRFVLGFGREAPARARLEVVWPDGRLERRELAVAQRTYEVQRIDGLPPRMVSPPEEVLARIRAEAERVAAARAVDRAEPMFESGFAWPVHGPVTGVYGSQRILNGEPRQPHYGLDIAAPEGTPVRAAAEGVVAIADRDMYFSGGTVLLDHGHGLTTAYLHLKEIQVRAGQRVRRGEPIGTVGATGRVTGAHLDWRVNWFDERLDPALLVPPMPQAEAAAE